MKSRPVDPAVQALLDEAKTLPDCSAHDVLLERAATLAESFDDLDTAWSARCQILSSSSAHEAPRFENLFVTLAWCLALSDRDPRRFAASRVLWQYKWVAEHAPGYASIPRSVLERIIDDMDARFINEGWGRRAGLHKRISLFRSLGEPQRARALLDDWRAAPRDRGADCNACEAGSLSDFYATLGEDDRAVTEARPVILGRLTCATVPHSTFGDLLFPLARLKRHALARELYDKGRRLVAAKEDGGATLAAPYLLYAAFIGETDHARAMLRNRLPQAINLRSDADRLRWFGLTAMALRLLAARGVPSLTLPRIPGLIEDEEASTEELARRLQAIATTHADALDQRNGNDAQRRWLADLERDWQVARP